MKGNVGVMLDGRHPPGRLFYVLLSVLLLTAVSQAQAPAMTTIGDVVYRADGTPAAGTLLISWPAFVTADSKPVSAGRMSFNIAAAGHVDLALAPNQGAAPSGTFYTVLYKLDDGTTNTEYWVVPTSSPTSIAAIRTRLASASAVPQQVYYQTVTNAMSLSILDQPQRPKLRTGAGLTATDD